MRTLVVGPAWVGDMVMAEPLCAALARDGDAVDVLAPAATAGIAERMPSVDAVRVLPLRHGQLGLGQRLRGGRQLRGLYDLAVVLPNSWKSALLPWSARIPTRRGWRGEQRFLLLNQALPLDGLRWPRMIDRFMALASSDFPMPSGISSEPRLSSDAEAGRRLLAEAGVVLSERVVALCPGAEFGPAKRWPGDHFGELAQRLGEGGIRAVLLGGAGDREVAAEIRDAAPDVIDLTGRTSLADAIDVLACADAVVSNDSGLMHVAAAVGTPLVALYGSSSPDFTPPLTQRAEILARSLGCRPCFERRCPLTGEAHLACLRGIGVNEVHAALDRALTCAS